LTNVTLLNYSNNCLPFLKILGGNIISKEVILLKKRWLGIISIMFVLAFFGTSVSGGKSVKYVGVKKCKMCHIKEYKSWKKTEMATSFENLKPGVKAEAKKKAGLDPQKDYTHDPKCLKCHTTGYGKPGGFKSIEETPKLAGVQCEECHGPGSEYRKVMRNRKFKMGEAKAAGLIIPSENEKVCLECHGGESPFNEKLDPKYKFNFKERLKKTHKHYPLRYKH